MDSEYFSDVAKLREDTEKLRLDLEDRGEGSIFSMLQSDIMPTVDKLVEEEERVDILCSIDIPVGSEVKKVLRWYQGKVKSRMEGRKIKGKDIPKVMIEWDGIPDVKGW